MSDRSDLDLRVHRARELLAPSRAQRERVREGLATRADFRAPDAESSRGAAPAGARGSGAGPSASWPGGSARAAVKAPRVLVLVQAGVLVGVGFALGYWFSEMRASERAVAPSDARALVGSSARVERGAGAANESVSNGTVSNGTVSNGTVSTGTVSNSEMNGSVPPRADAGPAPSETERSRGALSSPPLPRAPRRSHPVAADAASASREELALLQRAERAIRAGDGALAHSFIDELEARFPKTIWREERDAVLVLAACTLEEPGAAERARTFLARHASSMYHDRITSVCRLADGAPLETNRSDGSPSVEHSSVRRKIP